MLRRGPPEISSSLYTYASLAIKMQIFFDLHLNLGWVWNLLCFDQQNAAQVLLYDFDLSLTGPYTDAFILGYKLPRTDTCCKQPNDDRLYEESERPRGGESVHPEDSQHPGPTEVILDFRQLLPLTSEEETNKMY